MAWICMEFDGWLDVAPSIQIDGESFMSDTHTPGENCWCNPRMEWHHKYNWPMWFHNDPEADEVPVKQ